MEFREGLTFDDVLLVPKYSDITSRSQTDLSTKLSKNISLNIPLISANMDTVTESQMAVTMAREGGIGIIHRFLSVEEEVADMQAIADKEGAGITIEPWDYRFYAEKVRKAKYDLDSNEVKQYLQLDKLREAMFYVAGRVFNFNFSPVKEGEVPVFHEDVKVWEVTDKDSGEHIGLWYLDPFARQGKQIGRAHV